MASTYSTGDANARASAIKTAYANGIIVIFGGTKPATANDTEGSAPILAIITLNSGAFTAGVATNGINLSDPVDGVLSKVDGGWYRYRQELVDAAPAIEWSLAQEKVLLRDIGYDLPGFGRVWRSTEGVCVGTDDGLVFNKTKDKVRLPVGYYRGACLIKDYTVISTVA